MEYYRNMPHFQPMEALFFITMRLAGSIPMAVIMAMQEEHERTLMRIRHEFEDVNVREQETYKQQKRYFAQFDSWLELNEPYWLKDAEVANAVVEALRFRNDRDYDLIAFCIMSNHIHFVIDTRHQGNLDKPLFRILQSFKRHTARKANQLLKRSGAFWQAESYDHVIRNDEELTRIIQYVLENPVKAGLVGKWQDWPYSYVQNGWL